MATKVIPKTLWIGGTSGLARSYLNTFGFDGIVLAGLESTAPSWVPQGTKYVSLDLRTGRGIVPALFDGISMLIIGVRAPLVTGNGNAHEELLLGLELLIEHAIASSRTQPMHAIHISSVAACNHLESQIGISETTAYPQLQDYRGSYDRFKRRSEEILNKLQPDDCSKLNDTATCNKSAIVVHLRLSAIFSDSPTCIQCNSLALQARIGPSVMPLRIDCNSSRNVAHAIRMLQQELVNSNNLRPLQNIYLYTRPISEPPDTTYGDYLRWYIDAHNITWRIIVPFFVVTWLTEVLHWIVWETGLRLNRVGVLVSIDYLLQVAYREHTFDCSRFHKDFPNFAALEETNYECFVRRRRQLQMAFE